MSRDLTCNETMPALDDNENISDVRRLVNSRVINQQPFSSQLNLLSANCGSTNINHNTTVRDVVSSRMRNKIVKNDSMFPVFNSPVNQPSTSSPYWIKTTGLPGNVNLSENIDTTNLLQTLMNETNRSLVRRQEDLINQINLSQPVPQTKYTINNVQSAISQAVNEQIQCQPAIYSNQLINHTVTSNPSATTQQKSILTTNYRSAPSGIGIAISYNNISAPNQTGSHSIIAHNVSAGSSGLIVASNYDSNLVNSNEVLFRSQPITTNVSSASTAITKFSGYVLPNSGTSVSVINNGNAGSTIIYSTSNSQLQQQKLADSVNSATNRLILRQHQYQTTASSLTSPSSTVIISSGTSSTPFIQHQQPIRSSSTYPADITVNSIVRSSNASPSKIAIFNQQLGLTKAASPYTVILPSRNESALQNVARESPNGFSNYGRTTPTQNSQIPPHSHSSPRPSILKGNSVVRRYIEKDLNSASSSNLSAVNFTDSNASTSTVSAVNFSSSTSTSADDITIKNLNCSSEDYLGKSDDSPRKRQRKQQFDSSQQLQDKLMMEVRADPQLDQLAIDNSTMWKLGAGIIPSSSSSNVVKTEYSSGSEFNGGFTLIGNEPRRRGRPRSIHRNLVDISYLPTSVSSLSGTNVLLASHENGNNNLISTPQNSIQKLPNYLSTITHGGTISSNVLTSSANILTSNVVSVTNNNVAPRSFMVDVDSMLQASSSTKRPRKYKKRAPELDPQTGEPIKKPRKKGSGRKSKKELLLIEAAKKGISLNLSGFIKENGNCSIGELLFSNASKNRCVTTSELQDLKQNTQMSQHHQNSSLSYSVNSAVPTNTSANQVLTSISQSSLSYSSSSVSLFSRLESDEQNVVSFLCKKKSQSTKLSAEQTNKENSDIIDCLKTNLQNNTEKENKIDFDNLNSLTVSTKHSKDLLNAKNYEKLCFLWKTTDRNLANSVASDYDTISKCITDIENKKINIYSNKLLNPFNNQKNLTLCPVFKNFDEYKYSKNLWRLLPTACKYFTDSKELIQSIQNYLLGLSAYYLAKNLIKTHKSVSKQNICKNDNKIKQIASLDLNHKILHEKCENLFNFLYDEVKERSKTFQKCDKLSLEKEMLIDMDVIELLDSVLDNVNRENLYEIKKETNKSCQNSSNSAVFSNFLSENAILNEGDIANFIKQLPEQTRQVLLGNYLNECINKPRKPMRSLQKYYESSSESDNHVINEDDDFDDENIPTKKKLSYALKRIQELAQNSHCCYWDIRKMALTFFKKMESERYLKVMSTKFSNIQNLYYKDEYISAKQIKEHLENAFLFDQPEYKGTIKKMWRYDTNKSVFCNPLTEQTEYFDYNKIDFLCSDDYQKPLPVSYGIERLRKLESNFLTLNEIKKIQIDNAHIGGKCLMYLQQKYGNKQNINFVHNVKLVTDSEMLVPLKEANSTTLNSFINSCKFTPSVIKKFPLKGTKEEQLKYVEDSCKRAHDKIATLLTVLSFRKETSRQCNKALIELIKTKASKNCRKNKKNNLSNLFVPSEELCYLKEKNFIKEETDESDTFSESDTEEQRSDTESFILNINNRKRTNTSAVSSMRNSPFNNCTILPKKKRVSTPVLHENNKTTKRSNSSTNLNNKNVLKSLMRNKLRNFSTDEETDDGKNDDQNFLLKKTSKNILKEGNSSSANTNDIVCGNENKKLT